MVREALPLDSLASGPSMFALTLVVLGSLVVSFMCSIAEAVVLSVGHAQIEALGKSRAARILKHFKRDIDIPIAAIVSFHTVAHTVGASWSGARYVSVFGDASLWIFSLVFTIAVLIFSEILPKTIGVTYVVSLAPAVAYFVSGLIFVLRPLLWVTNIVARLLRGGKESPVTSIEEIRLLVSLGRTEGALAGRVADMIEGAAALRELSAYDVMVPRSQVTFLSGERNLEQNLALIRRSGHSRFPYTPDANLDNVQGVVLAKELLFRLRETPHGIEFENILSPLIVIPASAALERVLRTFQDERRHMAIVVDEYGGTQGIITLEDVLEEIVGEIEDESDRRNNAIFRRSDDNFVCRGSAETRKVFEQIGIEEDTDMVTISGFVAELLGRLPKTGDNVDYKGFRFIVARASQRRAERIEIHRLHEREREDEDE